MILGDTMLKEQDAGISEIAFLSPETPLSSSPFGKKGVQAPYSVIYGNNIKIHQVILGIILYHKPPPAVIYDPTCGKENYQFKPWLEKGTLKKLGYTFISADIKPYGDVRCSYFRTPLRDKSVDIIVYDPPYLPEISPKTDDERHKDYGIERYGIGKIFKNYSQEVFKQFHRILIPIPDKKIW